MFRVLEGLAADGRQQEIAAGDHARHLILALEVDAEAFLEQLGVLVGPSTGRLDA